MNIVHKQVKARMSMITIYNGTVYLAGIIPDKKQGTTAAEQTTEVLQKIEGLLEEAGTDKSRLLKATIWLRDIKYYDEMNTVWDAWVVPGLPPVRACVEARMSSPDVLVEIQITAGVGTK